MSNQRYSPEFRDECERGHSCQWMYVQEYAVINAIELHRCSVWRIYDLGITFYRDWVTGL